MFIVPGFEKLDVKTFEWPNGWAVKVIIDSNVSCQTFLNIIEFAETSKESFIAIPYTREELRKWDRNVKSLRGACWDAFRPRFFFPSLDELNVFLYAFGELPIRKFEMQVNGRILNHYEVKYLLDNPSNHATL